MDSGLWVMEWVLCTQQQLAKVEAVRVGVSVGQIQATFHIFP